MSNELEVRRGRVEPITVTVRVSGTDNNVSSTTVTMFELDGVVVEYSGGSLPFRSGDEAIVAGYLGGDGVFYADAVRLPRQGVTVGGSSPFVVLFGAVFVAVGFGAFLFLGGEILTMDASDWPMPGVIAVVLFLAFSIAFPAAGLAVMRQGRRSSRARAMLDSPSAPSMQARRTGF